MGSSKWVDSRSEPLPLVWVGYFVDCEGYYIARSQSGKLFRYTPDGSHWYYADEQVILGRHRQDPKYSFENMDNQWTDGRVFKTPVVNATHGVDTDNRTVSSDRAGNYFRSCGNRHWQYLPNTPQRVYVTRQPDADSDMETASFGQTKGAGPCFEACCSTFLCVVGCGGLCCCCS